jgi:lipopolysaccharide biosynthesis glycosyltransferase
VDEKLNKQGFFLQREIENLAVFIVNYSQKFWITLTFNNGRKNEYTNKLKDFSFTQAGKKRKVNAFMRKNTHFNVLKIFLSR